MSIPILGELASLGETILDKIWPDAGEEEKQKFQQFMAIYSGQLAVVLAEAQGGSWLQRSWRPLLMLLFAGLITARWFGLSASGLSETEYLELWSIVKLGLGGYVIGRTAEKVVPDVVRTVAESKKTTKTHIVSTTDK